MCEDTEFEEDTCKICKLPEWCLCIGVLCPFTTCYTSGPHHVLCCGMDKACLRNPCSPYGLCGWMRFVEGLFWCLLCPIGVFVALYYFLYVKYQIRKLLNECGEEYKAKQYKLRPYLFPIVGAHIKYKLPDEDPQMPPVKSARHMGNPAMMMV